MEDNENEINLEEDVLELDEELIDNEDAIDLEETNDNEETDEEQEIENQDDESEEIEEELDYKAMYEAEQKKRKDLQNALNSERKQRKKSVKESDVTLSETYRNLIEKNIDSDIAEAIAKSIEKRTAETTSQIEDLKFEASIVKTSKKAGFEDIEEYSEEIRPFVDKGLTVEQAYYVAVGEKNKTNTKAEVKRQIEAKLKNQKAKSLIQKIDTTGGSGSINSKEKYNSMDIKMAKAFGIPIEEYVNYKNINSEKDYLKMKNNKK